MKRYYERLNVNHNYLHTIACSAFDQWSANSTFPLIVGTGSVSVIYRQTAEKKNLPADNDVQPQKVYTVATGAHQMSIREHIPNDKLITKRNNNKLAHRNEMIQDHGQARKRYYTDSFLVSSCRFIAISELLFHTLFGLEIVNVLLLPHMKANVTPNQTVFVEFHFKGNAAIPQLCIYTEHWTGLTPHVTHSTWIYGAWKLPIYFISTCTSFFSVFGHCLLFWNIFFNRIRGRQYTLCCNIKCHRTDRRNCEIQAKELFKFSSRWREFREFFRFVSFFITFIYFQLQNGYARQTNINTALKCGALAKCELLLRLLFTHCFSCDRQPITETVT